jgi:hypothetical protein
MINNKKLRNRFRFKIDYFYYETTWEFDKNIIIVLIKG